MQSTPPYNDILEDETLAPLKRNHACLQVSVETHICPLDKHSLANDI